MGVHDRDWYKEATRQRERYTYSPKAFRAWRGTPAGMADSGHRLPTPALRPILCWLAVGLVLFVASHAFLDRRERLASEEAACAANQAKVQAEQQAQDDEDRRRVKQVELDRQEAIRVQAIRERQQGDERTARAIFAEAVRKQWAWERFYQPPAYCNEAGTVECANAFIRAKRSFAHRFITCKADVTPTTAEFLRYYFLTETEMLKIGEAYPGGAGRNRTLGLEKLMALEVPVPSVAAQNEFNQLQGQTTALKAKHSAIREANGALVPATLERVFAGSLGTTPDRGGPSTSTPRATV